MLEANPVIPRGQHALLLRLEERRAEVSIRGKRRCKDGPGRLRGGGRGERELPCGRRQGPDPRDHQLLEVAGDGQRLRRLQIAVWCERASHLERVEGIPSGGVGQASQKRPRKRRAEAGLHHVMERGKRERTGGDAQQSVLRQRSGEPQWQLLSGPHPVCEQYTDFRRQAAKREGQRLCRGRIEPLDVVHGEQHRAPLGTRCEHADEGGCRRPRGGSVAGVVPGESASQRALLDWRKGRSHLIERLDDQIRERDVRQLLLALSWLRLGEPAYPVPLRA